MLASQRDQQSLLNQTASNIQQIWLSLKAKFIRDTTLNAETFIEVFATDEARIPSRRIHAHL